MKVLIITPDIVGPVRNGGIGTAFFHLSRFFAKQGHAITVLYTSTGYIEEESEKHWEEFYRERGITFCSLPIYENIEIQASAETSASYRVYIWLKNNPVQYDLVLAPEWRGRAYYCLLAKYTGIAFQRTIFLVNTHSPTAWAIEGNLALPQLIDQIECDHMERESVRLADIVVSPSQYMIDWMKSRGWALPPNTLVIQNILGGIGPRSSTTSPTDNIEEVAFFGRLEPRKGIELFCAAVDRLALEIPDRIRRISFIGKLPPFEEFDALGYIRNRAKNWHFDVSLYTGLNHEQAISYLRDKRCLAVTPSLVENSPYTVLECLEEGVPFLASRVGGIAELISPADHDRILFDPVPSKLARMLRQVIVDGYGALAKRQVDKRDVERRWGKLVSEQVAQTAERGAPPAPSAPTPRVSVCLVHFERPHLLRRAVDSLRQQTYQNLEVVLVDDGSRSPEALAFLDALRFEFELRGWTILRQENGYLGKARNLAARAASGEYLLFMDDDNVAKPHEIETFVRAATLTGADILTTVSELFEDSTRAPSYSERYWLPLGGSTAVGLFKNCFGDANALWRRSAFLEIGGFSEHYGVGHEDWELFARACLRGYRLVLIPDALFRYRISDSGMLRSGSVERDHSRSVLPYVTETALGLAGAFALGRYLRERYPLSPRTPITYPPDPSVISSESQEVSPLLLRSRPRKYESELRQAASDLAFALKRRLRKHLP